MKKLRVGLYGRNGHQIHSLLENHPWAELAAIACFDRALLPDSLRDRQEIQSYDSLGELLTNAEVDLVSLCSPRRVDQARDAIACLRAGKHVYAEKPAALYEADLDEILAVAAETGRAFYEMDGTIFSPQILAMREVVRSGKLGTVVQVFVQKSYPYYDGRPQDEAIDGGLIGQNAVHAARFIEHLTGIRIVKSCGFETGLGNPGTGDLQMAASLSFSLENGGCATVLANYLNPRGTKIWGNEDVRIFGTKGMVEATAGCQKTRLVLGDEDLGALEWNEPVEEYFLQIARHLLGQGTLPFTQEEALHPTRVVLRAKAGAVQLT